MIIYRENIYFEHRTKRDNNVHVSVDLKAMTDISKQCYTRCLQQTEQEYRPVKGRMCSCYNRDDWQRDGFVKHAGQKEGTCL